MLKAIRNKCLDNNRIQGLVREASRSRIIPKCVYTRLPPLGCHPVNSPAGNRFSYFADIHDMLARHVVWENLRKWEVTSLRVLSELARTAELFLDVGAYWGVYSLVACADGPSEVIAFEPNPNILPILLENIQVNGWQNRITVIPKGASVSAGIAHLTVPFDTTATRIDEEGTGPLIELTSIDEILIGRKVDIIKIDVEGHESEVCKGARQSLEKYHPALIIESLAKQSFVELVAILEPLGYVHCQHLGQAGPQLTKDFIDAPTYANFLWTAPRNS
jgi:FkbM family methyltransferase